MRDLITREQAIELVGLDAVERVDAEHCECTNIVGYNGACQGDELTEWAADVDLPDDLTIRAYYYTTNEQDQAMTDADGDGAAIDWEISGYEIF